MIGFGLMCWCIPWAIATLVWAGAGWTVDGRARMAVRAGLGLLLLACALELIVVSVGPVLPILPAAELTAVALVLGGSALRAIALLCVLAGVVMFAGEPPSDALAERLDGDHDPATG